MYWYCYLNCQFHAFFKDFFPNFFKIDFLCVVVSWKERKATPIALENTTKQNVKNNTRDCIALRRSDEYNASPVENFLAAECDTSTSINWPTIKIGKRTICALSLLVIQMVRLVYVSCNLSCGRHWSKPQSNRLNIWRTLVLPFGWRGEKEHKWYACQF